MSRKDLVSDILRGSLCYKFLKPHLNQMLPWLVMDLTVKQYVEMGSMGPRC